MAERLFLKRVDGVLELHYRNQNGKEIRFTDLERLNAEVIPTEAFTGEFVPVTRKINGLTLDKDIDLPGVTLIFDQDIRSLIT